MSKPLLSQAVEVMSMTVFISTGSFPCPPGLFSFDASSFPMPSINITIFISGFHQTVLSFKFLGFNPAVMCALTLSHSCGFPSVFCSFGSWAHLWDRSVQVQGISFLSSSVSAPRKQIANWDPWDILKQGANDYVNFLEWKLWDPADTENINLKLS